MKNESLLKGNAFFEKYVRKNFLKYMAVLFLYVIGFLAGIHIFHQSILVEETKETVLQYVQQGVEKVGDKENNNIANFVKQDFTELCFWGILSFSIVGAIFLLFSVFFRALSMGITISALMEAIGISYGVSFSILIFMVPVILKLLSMLFLYSSSLKFMENVFQYKKEIKYELIRHSVVFLVCFFIFCLIMLYRVLSFYMVQQIL